MRKLSKNLIKYLYEQEIFFVHNGKKISYLKEGQYLFFEDSLKLEKHTRIRTGNFLPSMGSFSYTRSAINPSRIEIGRYCSLADNIRVFDEDHPLDTFTTSTLLYRPRLEFAIRNRDGNDFKITKNVVSKQKKVIIKNDVWVGSHVALKPGITLHNGCCVGTGSVVTKDVPPYSIVAGNPARVVKMRFPEEIVKKLLETKWWDYLFAEFKDVDANTKIEDFINIFNELKSNGRILPFNPNIYTANDLLTANEIN